MKSHPQLNALTYSRVSTNDKGQNPEVQTTELRRYCVAREWAITEDIVDHEYSGRTDQRPGLKRLMALVRARKVDVVVVTKLDRMARSLKHLVSVLDEFSSLGVLFVSVGDQIDMGTASGRLMLHIVAAFAEFECALVRERTLAGLAYARRQGKRLGRPITRPSVAILRLRGQGLSYSQIQRQRGVSRPAIRRALLAAGTESPKNRGEKVLSNQGEYND